MVPRHRPQAELQQGIGNTGAFQRAHLSKSEARGMATNRIGFQQGNLDTLPGQEVGGEAADDAAPYDYYIPVIIGQ